MAPIVLFMLICMLLVKAGKRCSEKSREADYRKHNKQTTNEYIENHRFYKIRNGCPQLVTTVSIGWNVHEYHCFDESQYFEGTKVRVCSESPCCATCRKRRECTSTKKCYKSKWMDKTDLAEVYELSRRSVDQITAKEFLDVVEEFNKGIQVSIENNEK